MSEAASAFSETDSTARLPGTGKVREVEIPGVTGSLASFNIAAFCSTHRVMIARVSAGSRRKFQYLLFAAAPDEIASVCSDHLQPCFVEKLTSSGRGWSAYSGVRVPSDSTAMIRSTIALTAPFAE